VNLDSLHEMGQYPLHQTLVECLNTDRKSRKMMPDGKEQTTDAEPVNYEHLVGWIESIESIDNSADSILSMPRDDFVNGKEIPARQAPATRFGSYADEQQVGSPSARDQLVRSAAWVDRRLRRTSPLCLSRCSPTTAALGGMAPEVA